MLHIFHVEPGTMITLDMDMAIESVGAVKQHIATLCDIPVDKQVLLVSGGASLDNDNLVCSYSAGTDTSPIFLFSVCAIESGTLPSASIDCGSDADLSPRVAAMRALPVAQATVLQRTQLAMEAYEAARDISRTCKQLMDEQHLQLQGWGAVVANLEDLHTAFKRKVEAYRKVFDDYLEERLAHLDFLNHFHHDLLILSKIPMLTALLEAELAMNKEQQATEVTESINGSANSKAEDTVDTNCKPLTVSDWIASSDSKSAVEELFEHCKQGLEQINDRVIDALYREINSILDASNDMNLKEVPGLRERLLGLEQLNADAKKLVQDQADLAQSFQRNQQNPNLGDLSVLPDLCASHKEQLNVLLENHKRLRDIRRRCIKAKNELSGAIYQRLKWVQHVQNSITVSNNKQVMYLENLKRIRQHLLIIQQIHLAPSTYLTAVAEVVRRRSFSQAFLLWASELACHLLTIHNDELARRRDFQSLFNGHFLNSLFPGMEDTPPDYATQAPSVFDNALPAVTTEDVEYLRRELARLDTNEIPHLDQLLEALEGVGGKGEEFNTTLANLLLVRSKLKTDLIGETGTDEDNTGDETMGNDDSEAQGGSQKDDQRNASTFQPILSSTLSQPIVAHLKDWDKGCESETDTEEFEKLCQSPLEQPHQLPEDAATARSKEISGIISMSTTQDAATRTAEDNLHSSRLAYTTQQSILSKLFLLSTQGLLQLRSELTNIKSLYLTNKNSIEQQVESLSSSWENLTVERDSKERDIIQKMSVAHELALGSFRGQVQDLTKKGREMKVDWEKVVRQLQELKTENQLLQQSNDSLIIHKELSLNHEEHLKETVDRLNHEHKAEMENLRVRFRLMSAEVETSDESLTKLRKQFYEEKENAVGEAVLLESRVWKDRINRLNSEHQLKMDEAVVEIQKQEGEKMKRLLEREKNLQLECIKYRTSLQQLAESETEARNVELQERVDMLEKELEFESNKWVVKEAREEDLTGSVAPYDGKIDVATSPIRHSHHSSTTQPSTSTGATKSLTRSQTALVRAGHLTIDSCTVGDHVLVLWDTDHESYIILQRCSVQHFLHSDCLVELGLAGDAGGGGGGASGASGASGSGSGRRARAEEKREGRDASKRLQYFVGEVVDKEYCNAVKNENRYKVPKDTKFYRVKVKHSDSLPRESSSKSSKEPQEVVMSQSQSASASNSTSRMTTQTQISHSTHVMCQSLPSSLTDSDATSVSASPDNSTKLQQASAPDTTDSNMATVADGVGSSFDDLSSSETTNRVDSYHFIKIIGGFLWFLHLLHMTDEYEDLVMA